MRDNPKPQEIYRHFKGGLYQILTLAKHAQSGGMLVIYQALYEDFSIYARELDEFLSETDHEKYPSAIQKYRFERVEQMHTDLEDSMQTIELRGNDKEEAIEKTEMPQAEEPQTEETINIDPLVMEFLDADSYEERLNILAALHGRITNEMINTMSVAVDVEINEGDIEERYEALKTCLVTLEKYECNRLR